MIRATRIATCVGLLALAASLPLSEHEETQGIYVPWFIQPDVDTTWTSTQNYYVQWDIVPPVIDNFDTALYFVINPNAIGTNRTLETLTLATGFNFTEGQVEITAPKASGKYRLLLEAPVWGFVWSPLFTLNRS